MNADILLADTSKYEKLDKSNKQIYKQNNSDDLQVIRDVSNTCELFDNLNQSAEQKRKPNSNSTQASYTSFSPTKTILSTSGKAQKYKLVDSRQVSTPFYQSDRKTFLLDTYAHIAASNNRRYSKRLHEFVKPKKQARNDQNDCSTNFDLNYWHAIKTHAPKMKHSSENSKKK